MPSGESEAHKRGVGLDWQLCTAILLGVGLIAPLVVVPGMFFPYVVPRNILFRVAVELATAIALPTSLRRIAATDFEGVDASRTIQWDAAIAGFRDRPILGYGPDNHHLVWSAHFDPRSEKLGAEVFDRTHNQFLEILATIGIVGAIRLSRCGSRLATRSIVASWRSG